jgi:hypothetical protein
MDLQTNQTTYRLGFIGAGKLGASVIHGLIGAKFCPPGEIMASEPNAEVRGWRKLKPALPSRRITVRSRRRFYRRKASRSPAVVREIAPVTKARWSFPSPQAFVAAMNPVPWLMRAMTNTPSDCRGGSNLRQRHHPDDLSPPAIRRIGVRLRSVKKSTRSQHGREHPFVYRHRRLGGGNWDCPEVAGGPANVLGAAQLAARGKSPEESGGWWTPGAPRRQGRRWKN